MEYSFLEWIFSIWWADLIIFSYQEFSTSGHAYTDTGKASGNLETKYKICNYGLTFTQKWNTDNTLGTEISWENKVRERWKLFVG